VRDKHQKKAYLEEILDLVIDKVLKYMENFNPRIREFHTIRTEKIANYCPNVEVGIFFELLFSIFY
jgi:hypothetical protein